MKKTLLLLLSLFTLCQASAQWQGTNPVYFNAGNVGIGTATPNERLTVLGNIHIPLASSVGFIQSTDKFSHNGNFIGNYSLGWSNDSWQSGAPSAYFSGYGGIKFFTQASPRVVIDYNGNVGIGTTTPNAKLDVGSDISSGTLGTVFGRLPEGNSSGAGTFLGVRGYGTQPVDVKSFALEHSFYGLVNSAINFHRGGGMTGGFMTFNTDANTEQMRITPSGNVAIGTTDSKGYKLAVAGKAVAEEVTVKLQGSWPDYVFNSDYNLLSLEEIKTYIDKNKHLPEVPSAKEMEANGVQLGEMNMLLLKKIEELTLYVIELKKQNDLLQEKFNKIQIK